MADEEPTQSTLPEAIEEEPAEEAATEQAAEAPADEQSVVEEQPAADTAEAEAPEAAAEAAADEAQATEAEAAGENQEETQGETAEGGAAETEGDAPPSDVTGEEGAAAPVEGGEEAGEGEAVPAGEEGAEPPTEGEEQEAQPEGEGWEGAEEAAAAEGEDEVPVPQSDTFEGGARPESPVAVGEKLSREGTPTGEQTQAEEQPREASPPVPGTPDGVRNNYFAEEMAEQDEDEEDYEDEPQFDREQLINRYNQALTERHQLQDKNYQLQHKLAEFFRKKKADERQDVDKNVADQEQRYLKHMGPEKDVLMWNPWRMKYIGAILDELRRQEAEKRELYKEQIEEMEARCEERKQHVREERLKFIEFNKQIALNAVNSRSGKPIPPRDVEQYLQNESRKEEEVVKVRLENIKLKNKLRKKEQHLKSKEELAEGLHMIDFEQLKIENQTYNEKIEERNEELLKLRKKITSTVQVLTHLKEKLQFVQGENGQLNVKLRDVEEDAAKKRDILSRTKQARDALRIDNQRLRQNCGLLGNEPLLRDFEERKDEGDDLKMKLDRLKMQHAELTLNLNGVRRKIDQAKQGRM